MSGSRSKWAVGVVLLAIGCSSSGKTVSTTVVVGAAGGRVAMTGIALDVPAGALTTPTRISITASNGVPSGYSGLSSLFQFAPDGLTFAKPVSIAIDLSSGSTASAALFWSRPSGDGYDNLGGSVSGSRLTGTVQHFSRGFVAVADAPSDMGTASSNLAAMAPSWTGIWGNGSNLFLTSSDDSFVRLAGETSPSLESSGNAHALYAVSGQPLLGGAIIAVGAGGTIVRVTQAGHEPVDLGGTNRPPIDFGTLDGGVPMVVSSGTSNDLYAVYADTGADVYAVGAQGTIVHSRDSGASWAVETSGTSAALRSVWGSSDVYAVGDGGTILYSSGDGNWTALASGTTQNLNAVWGRFSGDIVAAGAHGTLLHSSGTTPTDLAFHGPPPPPPPSPPPPAPPHAPWTALASGTTADLFGLGSGLYGDAYVVGSNGTILRADDGGTSFVAVPSGTTETLRAVWEVDRSDVHAVGDNRAHVHLTPTFAVTDMSAPVRDMSH